MNDYRNVQSCYYCGKDLYAVDDDSYVVCNKCWKKEGLDKTTKGSGCELNG